MRDALKQLDDIKDEVKNLHRRNEKGTTILKRWKQPHINRVILTDEFAFFSLYVKNKYIDDTPVVCYRNGSYMYKHLEAIIGHVRIISNDDSLT